MIQIYLSNFKCIYIYRCVWIDRLSFFWRTRDSGAGNVAVLSGGFYKSQLLDSGCISASTVAASCLYLTCNARFNSYSHLLLRARAFMSGGRYLQTFNQSKKAYDYFFEILLWEKLHPRGSIAILPVHLHVLHPTGQSLQSSHEPSCLHPCSWCVPSIQTIHLTNSYQMLPNGSTPHAHCLVPWPNRSPRRKSQTHCQLSAPRLLLHSIHTYEYLNNQGFGHYFDTLFNAWHCLLLWQHQ